MYLRQWTPKIAKMESDSPCGIIEFTLNATLECPVCHEIISIESEGIHIGFFQGFLEGPYTPWIFSKWIKKIVKIQECIHCGTLSRIPKNNRDRFKEEVKTTVTEEWIENEKKKLLQYVHA